ncbi:hypothetical protein BSKO_01294 [Bryopsis sp. KO-2023]|nr:hypothetical protein BSKO_01294 [Bryopsis sp. KO-2023]
MDVILGAQRYLGKISLVARGNSHTFKDLLAGATAICDKLWEVYPDAPQHSPSPWGPRVGIMVPPGEDYVTSTWGTWLSGGIAVPLAVSHTPSELTHVLCDAQVSVVLASKDFKDRLSQGLEESKAKLHVVGGEGRSFCGDVDPCEISGGEWGALIMYTSGTTGRPKGVLHSHRSLRAQICGMSEAWGWTSEDHILNCLPLHHVHGIVNALYTPHYNGASVEILPKFSPREVWNKFQEGGVTLFSGVPTMYSHLLAAYDEMDVSKQRAARDAAASLRVFICGSSACPTPLMERWEQVTGHRLLERYGMTEIGMGLTNPLKGERRPGCVGIPLPGVSIKQPSMQEDSFEVLVKGDNLFTEYWGRPDATAAAFDPDGWFKTGDTACLTGNPPYFSILGRTSVDIIKSGGYKLSALEIESAILEDAGVRECSVMGVPDAVYGEVVVAMVVFKEGQDEGEERVKHFCGERLAKYKVPREVWVVDEIPRNTMGKVNKVELVRDFLGKFLGTKSKKGEGVE